MRGTGNTDKAEVQDSDTGLIFTSPISTHSCNSHSAYVQSFLTALG